MDNAPETLLRLLVREQGIESPRLFRREYERAARTLSDQDNDPGMRSATIGDRQYGRWLSGTVKEDPHPVACRILRYMFGRTARELLSPPPEVPDPTPLPPLGSVLPQRPHITEEELLMTANDAASHAGDAASRFLAPEAIAMIGRELASLAKRYHLKAPHDVFTTAKKVRDRVERTMPLTHRPDQSTELYLLAGQACALMASAAFDLGSHESAETLTYAALAYARPIDHHPLMAWSSGNLGLLAYWDDRPADALGFVQAAQDLVTSGTGKARLHSIAARAYAHLGQPDQTHRELETAAQADRDITDDLHDAIGGEFGFTRERAHMSAGTSWVVLRDGPSAVAESGAALELLQLRSGDDRSVKVEYEAAADRAVGYLLCRDLETAADVLEPVFATPPAHRVDGLMTRLHAVRRELVATPFQRARGALELGGRLEEFSRETARTILAPPVRQALG